MENLSTKQEYKPLTAPRRSELTAWILALSLAVALYFVRFQGMGRAGGFILLAFLALSAITMSIGNWVDRKTYLRIDQQTIDFFNGAREVSIKWTEISAVQILPGRIGDKIIVSSETARIRFQSLGKIKMSDKISGEVGFELGDQILETILERSGLAEVTPQQTEGHQVYSRQ
jgi:hypothetical protein